MMECCTYTSYVTMLQKKVINNKASSMYRILYIMYTYFHFYYESMANTSTSRYIIEPKNIMCIECMRFVIMHHSSNLIQSSNFSCQGFQLLTLPVYRQYLLSFSSVLGNTFLRNSIDTNSFIYSYMLIILVAKLI